MTHAPALPPRFLERFFGHGNEIRWAKIRPGAGTNESQELAPFLSQAKPGWTQLVLPRVVPGQKHLVWYALASSAQAGRHLRDDLLAFVGPSYTHFLGQQGLLNPKDPTDRLVAEIPGVRCYKLWVNDRSLAPECFARLCAMLKMQSQRPSTVRTVPRPVGRILRDFELATLSTSPSDAWDYLKELRQSGQVSARNLAFLEVHLHDSFGDEDALARVLDDGALVQARRPTRVTGALIRAVYRQQLQAFEDAGDPAGALAHFEEVVRPRFGRLYASMSGLRGPEITKSFLLVAATAGTPQAAQRDVLLDQYPKGAVDRGYIEALAGLIADAKQLPPEQPLLEQAKTARWCGDLDRALELLGQCERSGEVLAARMACAIAIGSLEAVIEVLAELEDAPTELRAELEQRPHFEREREQLLRAFDELAAPEPASDELLVAPPDDWLAWMDRLRTTPTWSGAVEVAKQGALAWNVEPLLNDPDAVAALAEGLVEEMDAEAARRLSHALPHWITFFAGRAAGKRAAVPVLLALFDRLLLLEDLSAETVKAAGRLIAALQEAHVGQAACGERLRTLMEAWKEVPALRLVEWGLDFLETLLTTRAVDRETQLAFAVHLRGEFDRWRERVDVGQVALFGQLARELRSDGLANGLRRPATHGESEHAENAMARALRGKRVALYSLRREVLRRAGRVLKDLVPGLEVLGFSDKVGSASLGAAARNSDVFVVVTGAAKHAATEFIKAQRPKDMATLEVHAVGTSALVRSLCDWAEVQSTIG